MPQASYTRKMWAERRSRFEGYHLAEMKNAWIVTFRSHREGGGHVRGQDVARHGRFQQQRGEIDMRGGVFRST